MQKIEAKSLAASISSRLTDFFEPREADNISRELMRHFCQAERLQLSMNVSLEISENVQEMIEQAINRLRNHEPLQHILGSVEFYGLEFKTDHRALIPRPETEELVDWILQDHTTTGLSVLDIGTGTGCIPIVLAKNRKQADVSAIDISEGALALARENARLNKVSVNFEQKDILATTLTGRYDIIVSNPPYIPETDQAMMSKNVLEYEPDMALFVPNDHPLIFYERIAELALNALKPEGSLYFEIHENYGDEVQSLLSRSGFSKITLRKDLQNKDRMIKATLL